jgi:hypothetical protein
LWRVGFEPGRRRSQQITVCPRWPLEYLPKPEYNTYDVVSGKYSNTFRFANNLN